MLIKEWLRELVEKEGIKVFENPSRIDSMLNDLFPQAKKERAAIKFAFGYGIEKDFIILSNIHDHRKKEHKLNQIRNKLQVNLWMSEEAVDFLIEVFAYLFEIKKKEVNYIQSRLVVKNKKTLVNPTYIVEKDRADNSEFLYSDRGVNIVNKKKPCLIKDETKDKPILMTYIFSCFVVLLFIHIIIRIL